MLATLTLAEKAQWRMERGLAPLGASAKPPRKRPELPAWMGRTNAGPAVTLLWQPERDKALRVIRAMRGQDDDFPNDFACEAHLYLGMAFQSAFPRWSEKTVSKACFVAMPDYHFFMQLIEIARGAEWVKPEIVAAARDAILSAGKST